MMSQDRAPGCAIKVPLFARRQTEAFEPPWAPHNYTARFTQLPLSWLWGILDHGAGVTLEGSRLVLA